MPTNSGHMPTSPFGQSSALEPHRAREAAESFGVDAERYDRTRPRYPDALVEAVVAASPGPDVLDVGCGTGIASRQFRAAGCRVLGVDIDPRMAAFARRGGSAVEVAAFEDWDPAGRSFDAVVAGQTWHWVDPAAGAAKAAAVLRPGGRLALFWNVFQPPPEVAAAFDEVHRRVLPDSPHNPWAAPALPGYSLLFDKAADGVRGTGAFDEPERWRFDWERPYRRDEWLDQMPTAGVAGLVPPDAFAALVAGTGEALDALGGTFTMGYAAVVVTATRTA
ncbi:class I SAM-dependent methyltransferase [Saccharothrix longispora]